MCKIKIMVNLILKCFELQLVELKEAEQLSLKESERLEKEILDVQELKVIIYNRSYIYDPHSPPTHSHAHTLLRVNFS